MAHFFIDIHKFTKLQNKMLIDYDCNRVRIIDLQALIDIESNSYG